MRVMAAASPSRTLIPSSSCSTTSPAAAAPRGSRHVIASLRVTQKWRASGIGALRREAITLKSMRRIAVRAEAVQGEDDSLNEKLDKAADEAGKETEESKQAWAKSVEDLKVEAQRIAEATEENANKVIAIFIRNHPALSLFFVLNFFLMQCIAISDAFQHVMARVRRHLDMVAFMFDPFEFEILRVLHESERCWEEIQALVVY